MKIELFVGEALVLSVAGVATIMLIESLILLILYSTCRCLQIAQKKRGSRAVPRAFEVEDSMKHGHARSTRTRGHRGRCPKATNSKAVGG